MFASSQHHIIDGGTMTSPSCAHEDRYANGTTGFECDTCGDVRPYTDLENIQRTEYAFLQDAGRAALKATASKEDNKVYEYRVNPLNPETYVVRPVVARTRFSA